jgi:hypothetical protein
MNNEPQPLATILEFAPPVRRSPGQAQAEAHLATPTCSVAINAHWTAHTLACRTKRHALLAEVR